MTITHVNAYHVHISVTKADMVGSYEGTNDQRKKTLDSDNIVIINGVSIRKKKEGDRRVCRVSEG